VFHPRAVAGAGISRGDEFVTSNSDLNHPTPYYPINTLDRLWI
jgi:hypothetical protein